MRDLQVLTYAGTPEDSIPQWICIRDRCQGRAALLALAPDTTDALLMQPRSFISCPCRTRSYRLIILQYQQASGVLDPINMNPQEAAVMFDAASQVDVGSQTSVTQPYMDVPNMRRCRSSRARRIRGARTIPQTPTHCRRRPMEPSSAKQYVSGL